MKSKTVTVEQEQVVSHSYPPDKGGKGGSFHSAGKGGYIPYNKTLTQKAHENRKRRTENLNKYGVEIIRYTNAEVLNNTISKRLHYIYDSYQNGTRLHRLTVYATILKNSQSDTTHIKTEQDCTD